jgi:glycosyltransferase involved in cell wall biosynthesis
MKHMKHEYTLSICMMVKDEEKNLARCLESIRPLLEKEDVELIIVDTGSSDRTPEIARSYTDKVYYHPWNNDFSSMRNITISYAKGMYLLILDADEVLSDPLLLYEYINDPRLRAYNTFLFKIRSFSTFERYTVIPQERVFRNDGEFRYEGAVHNQALYKKPVLGTDIYVDHYGYLFQDSALRERKFKRTASILRSELEKNPANPYYRFQLARSLSAHGDSKEALEEIRRAYGLISGDTKAMRLYCYIYSSYSSICFENGEYEEAIKVCKEGLEIRPENLDLYFIMARALAETDRKQEAAEAYGKYLELTERYDKLDISRDRAMEIYYTGTFFQDEALVYLVNEFMAQRNYQQAKERAIKIHDDKKKTALLVKILLKLEELDELARIYRENSEDKQISRLIADIVEMEKKSLNADYRQKIEEAFCTDGDDPYLLLNRIRRAEAGEKSALAEKALRQVDFSELPDYYAEMMSCIDSNTRLVVSTLKKLNKTKIKQYIKHLMDTNAQLEDFFEKYLAEEQVRGGDFHSLRVYISIAYVYLYSKAQIWRDVKIDPPESCYSIFKLYIKRGAEYISLLYNRERLRLYYDTLEDHEDRFFIALGYAAEAVERGDFGAGIRYFKEAAKAYPYMGCYMKRYKDELFPDIPG